MPRLKARFDRLSHLFLPLSVLVILLLINLIKGADYFKITMVNRVLYGNIPNILFGASELVILSIGMTLVTAAARGQDISIGESGAISSAIFVQYVLNAGEVTIWTILVGLLISCVAGIVIGAFNGTLVSFFNVQPMVATLILFLGGRSIAFIIDGKVSPILANPISNQIGTVIKGVPIQTPIILTAVFIVIVSVVLKVTNLRLYVEAVGINPNTARLNGINPKRVIFLTFLLMGICSAVAGFIAVNKVGRHDSVNLLKFIMMDAILAVALGGNSLSGGKFSITGSIIGAYTIEVLNRTLLRLEVNPEAIKAFKAVFIIILMVLASPVVRVYAKKVMDKAKAFVAGKAARQTGRLKKAVVSITDSSVKKEE
ncbi:MAG: ABC transporter permease [Firmicutes bacterium]|nr:ABC transporter permease [Bacillota bacterium]